MSGNHITSRHGDLYVSRNPIRLLAWGPDHRSRRGRPQARRELYTYLGGLFAAAGGPLAGRLGFFGVLPDWQDIEGTCAEIDFLFAEQKLCSGVGMYTPYGDKLPVPRELPAHMAEAAGPQRLCLPAPEELGLHAQAHRRLPPFPQPVVDYPLAMARAAVDLVFTSTTVNIDLVSESFQLGLHDATCTAWSLLPPPCGKREARCQFKVCGLAWGYVKARSC